MGALLVVTMWGASFVSTKVLISAGIGPVELYIYRFVIAYLLVFISSCKRLWADSLRDEMMFFLCGLCGSSIYFIAENYAVQYTRVSDVSMISSLSPLITTLLIGALYRNERPGRWTYISSIIALAGVGCIIFKDGLSGMMQSDDGGPDTMSIAVGDILALSCAFSWAVYSLVLRRVNATYSTQFITRKTFFYGIITGLPIWFLSAEPIAPAEVFLRPEVLGNLLFLGVGCSMAAYLLWTWVLGHLGAVKTNNYLYVQPICTMIIAAILFGKNDPITLTGCVGALLIIGGLYLGDYMTRRDAMRN